MQADSEMSSLYSAWSHEPAASAPSLARHALLAHRLLAHHTEAVKHHRAVLWTHRQHRADRRPRQRLARRRRRDAVARRQARAPDLHGLSTAAVANTPPPSGLAHVHVVRVANLAQDGGKLRPFVTPTVHSACRS